MGSKFEYKYQIYIEKFPLLSTVTSGKVASLKNGLKIFPALKSLAWASE
jgi:hypothetical protein